MLGQSGRASRPKHRLEAGPEAQKQKIASDCNFFAIRDCRDFLNRGLRPKMQQKWLYDGSFPLCRSEGESLIAKKLQKKLGFLFLRLADRRDGGRIPPRTNRSRTKIRASIRRATKKPPEGGFVLKYMAGPAGFPRSASALPLGASACGQIPKNGVMAQKVCKFPTISPRRASKTGLQVDAAQLPGGSESV